MTAYSSAVIFYLTPDLDYVQAGNKKLGAIC